MTELGLGWKSSIEELPDLPVMTDPEVLDAMDVLTRLLTPAVFFDEKCRRFFFAGWCF